MFRQNLLIVTVLATVVSGCSVGQPSCGLKKFRGFGNSNSADCCPQYSAPLYPGDPGAYQASKHRHGSRSRHGSRMSPPLYSGSFANCAMPMSGSWGMEDCSCAECVGDCGYTESWSSVLDCGCGMPHPILPNYSSQPIFGSDCSAPMGWTPMSGCAAPMTPMSGCAAPMTPMSGCAAPMTPMSGCAAPMTPMSGCAAPMTPMSGYPGPVPEPAHHPTVQEFHSPQAAPAPVPASVQEYPMQNDVAPLPPSADQTMWSVPRAPLAITPASGQMTQHQVTLPIAAR